MTSQNNASGCHGLDWSYDPFDNRTAQSIDQPYDANGNLISKVAPKENQTISSVTVTTTYSYDALNRLTQKTYNDNTTPTAQYFYDQSSAWGLSLTNPIGRVTTTQTIPPGSQNAQTATLSEYDPMGRITVSEECQPQDCANAPDLAVKYTYDLIGDVISEQEQDTSGAFNFTLTYVYDNIGELTTVTSSWSDYYNHPGTLLSGATYNAARQITADTLGNGIPESFGYTSRMWLNSVLAGVLPFNQVYGLNLGYAEDGTVAWADDSVNGDFTFTYDNLNRLATMSSPHNPSGCYGLSWTYDSVGNRTAQSVTSGTCPSFSAAVNSNNQLSGSPYQYDAAGNMTNDGSHTYAYDAAGRILKLDGGNGFYVYDAFGRRIEKNFDAYRGTSHVFLYDQAGRRIGSVTTKDADESHQIYAGSRLLAEYNEGTTYFYESDQLGTDRLLTDPVGNVVQTCTSEPFGDSYSCTGPGSEPTRFAGYFTDSESGLDYAPARYYSPALGRFMTPDPFGTPPEKPSTCSLGGPPADQMTNTLAHPESLTRYTYVVDSPATLTDPTGAQNCFEDPFQPGCTSSCDPLADPFCACDPETGICCDPALGCPTVLLLRGPVGSGVPARPKIFCQCELAFESVRFLGCGYVCTCSDGIPDIFAFRCPLKSPNWDRLCPLFVDIDITTPPPKILVPRDVCGDGSKPLP